MAEEVFPWLKSLPLAPEYHPTLIEFQDPISYIFKIEEEASKYGICKIIPPVPASPRKTIIANLNRSLSALTPDSSPTFTTKVQQIGFCPRRQHQPVKRSLWQSGEYYTLPQFEAKAKNFEKDYLKKQSNPKKGLSALEFETLYWKAQIDKTFRVEYASDMIASAFDQTVGGLKQGKKDIDDVMTVGESQWNMRSVARAKGSLLKFLKEELPGITSPMIYMGMLFSWFAWHVEDHDLHSLNYMHMGAAKTWYGVPMAAAAAFEEVIRADCYAGDISPLVAFSILGEKNTVLSPEVLLKAGVPCCRLVQNAGEFVVTFPRAYHSGFSHGFNCAEALNIATPGWLRIAQEAAIRRASIGFAPMMSHSQLLYDLALSFSSSEDRSSTYEPRSSRLKNELKYKVNGYVKQAFMEDVIKNNELLHALGNGSPVTLLSQSVLRSLTSLGICNTQNHESSTSGDGVLNQPPVGQPDMKSIFSCVSCRSPCYAGAAILQPTKAAAQSLALNVVVDSQAFSGIHLPIKSSSPFGKQKDISSLGLLALAYGDSSDSDELEDNHASDEIVSKIRMHVFCLRHAREIEQRLRPVGGVHMLLVCHPDYPSIDSLAKEVAKELGFTPKGTWTDLRYVAINEQDKAMILSALDDEQQVANNVNKQDDWAVNLGLNIFYSARLGRSSYYRKQMPYNLVIHNAFGHNDPSDDAMLLPKQSRNKQKKIIVAGKWCGKVWMSNKVHPFMLAAQAGDEDETKDRVMGSPEITVKLESNKCKRKRTLKVSLANKNNKTRKTEGSAFELKARGQEAKVMDPEDDESDYEGVHAYDQ